MQIQEDEEEERVQALAISLLRTSEVGPSGSKQDKSLGAAQLFNGP